MPLLIEHYYVVITGVISKSSKHTKRIVTWLPLHHRWNWNTIFWLNYECDKLPYTIIMLVDDLYNKLLLCSNEESLTQ